MAGKPPNNQTEAELDALIEQRKDTMPKSRRHGVFKGRQLKKERGMTKPTKPLFDYQEIDGVLSVYDKEYGGNCGSPWRPATREEEEQIRAWRVQEAADKGFNDAMEGKR